MRASGNRPQRGLIYSMFFTFAAGSLLLFGILFHSTEARAQSTNGVPGSPGQSFRAVQDIPGGPSYVDGELLVKFKPGASTPDVADVINRAAVTGAKHILTPAMRDRGDIGITRMTIGLPVRQAIQALQNHPAIDRVQPNWIYYHQGATPPSSFDDPYFATGSLWGMYDGTQSIPANIYGSAAAAAWISGFTGSSQVCVGVIDEGIDFNHPDLAANIWINSGETPDNGIDDDGNGYVDDVHGWNAFGDDGQIYTAGYDTHGTHVAGTIGAIGGNGLGVGGINWNVSIISGKFLGPDGSGTTSDAIEAIDYMTNLKKKGVNIVALNNSWGGGGYDPDLLDSINDAATAGILFVAAAGNGDYWGNDIDTDQTRFYPACYDTSDRVGYDAVISVTAINNAGAKASWANFGLTTVDLGAPGVGIQSTLPTGSYGDFDGTSMATPHVTGAIALYAALYPAANPVQIRNALLSSTTPTTSLEGLTSTDGRLNVMSFLEHATGNPILPISAPAAPTLVSATGISSSQIDIAWTANSTDNETGFRILRSDGWSTIVGPNRTTYSDQGLTKETTYTYWLYAYNAVGETAAPDSVFATTLPASGPAGTAAFVAKDTTTKGTWIGKYGKEGYHVVLDGVSYPPGVSMKVSYAEVWGWAYPYSTRIRDTRDLQSILIPKARGAACWYNAGDFEIDLNFSDNALHRIALYCLDWEGAGRSQRIDIIDPVSSTTLNSQNVSSFYGGQYLIWDVSGHVKLRLTTTGEKNAVLSGLFFDVPSVSPLPPTAPKDLTASAVSKSQINLAWTDDSNNETGFKIERAKVGGAFSLINTVPAGTTRYSNTGLTRNTTYVYRIRAYNDAGDSAYSNTATATTFR